MFRINLIRIHYYGNKPGNGGQTNVELVGGLVNLVMATSAIKLLFIFRVAAFARLISQQLAFEI